MRQSLTTEGAELELDWSGQKRWNFLMMQAGIEARPAEWWRLEWSVMMISTNGEER